MDSENSLTVDILTTFSESSFVALMGNNTEQSPSPSSVAPSVATQEILKRILKTKQRKLPEVSLTDALLTEQVGLLKRQVETMK